MPKEGREPGDAGLLMNAADRTFRNPVILCFSLLPGGWPLPFGDPQFPPWIADRHIVHTDAGRNLSGKGWIFLSQPLQWFLKKRKNERRNS